MLLFLSLCISVTFFFSLSTSFSHLSLSCRLNFKDPEAVRALTCTLLKEDFGLNIEIPLERLIPTVPLRLNYIHWVEDLTGAQGSPSRGIDIGTCSSLMQYHIPGSQLPAAHKALTTSQLKPQLEVLYSLYRRCDTDDTFPRKIKQWNFAASSGSSELSQAVRCTHIIVFLSCNCKLNSLIDWQNRSMFSMIRTSLLIAYIHFAFK